MSTDRDRVQVQDHVQTKIRTSTWDYVTTSHLIIIIINKAIRIWPSFEAQKLNNRPIYMYLTPAVLFSSFCLFRLKLFNQNVLFRTLHLKGNHMYIQSSSFIVLFAFCEWYDKPCSSLLRVPSRVCPVRLENHNTLPHMSIRWRLPNRPDTIQEAE